MGKVYTSFDELPLCLNVQDVADVMDISKPLAYNEVNKDGYRSWDYHLQVTKNGLIPSMSKPATPGDNAMAENFLVFSKRNVFT